jgi:hypothetical protein
MADDNPPSDNTALVKALMGPDPEPSDPLDRNRLASPRGLGGLFSSWPIAPSGGVQSLGGLAALGGELLKGEEIWRNRLWGPGPELK